MSAYAQVALGEICTVNPRVERVGFSDDMPVSFVPMAAVDGQLGVIAGCEDRRLAEVSKGYTAFEEGDVLFAKIIPCMENGKIALVRNLTNGIGRGSTEFYVLRPGNRVLGEYIWHFVRQPRFRSLAKMSFTGTAQQRVPRSFMENALIPLPSLDEQRRIVAILNRAAKIEKLRARAAERLREFIPALFIRMFGDPVENPMGWEIARVGDVADVVGGGTPRRNNPSYFSGTIPWATPTDITAIDDLFIGKTRETITELGLKESSARLLPENTVLLTSRATIGYTAVASTTMTTNQGFANLICGDRMDPLYLSFYLRHQRNRLIHISSGSTFKELSKSTLKKETIPLPPFSEQHRFAAIAAKSLRAAHSHAQATSSAKSLTASLMSCLLEDTT